ncbi:hypothetical protein [Streptomyces sp. NPDC003943]
MRPLVRCALAVLLVLAALLGAGTGAGAVTTPAEAETRGVGAAADPGAETHDAAEQHEAAAPVRGVRRPAPPRRTGSATPGTSPVPLPVASPHGPRAAAPRSTVMRC